MTFISKNTINSNINFNTYENESGMECLKRDGFKTMELNVTVMIKN